MDSFSPENNPELKRLFKTVSAKQGRADFLIVDNSEITDAQLVQHISLMLDKASIKSVSLDLSATPSVSDLLERMKGYKRQGYDFLHVTGGDLWLPKRQSFNDGTATCASVLNIAREKIFEVKMICAFYLSETGISTIARDAPDLWS